MGIAAVKECTSGGRGSSFLDQLDRLMKFAESSFPGCVCRCLGTVLMLGVLAAQDQPSEARVMRTYDVRSLLTAYFDQSAGALGVHMRDEEGAVLFPETAEEARIPDGHELVESLKMATGGARVWDGEGAPTILDHNSQMLAIHAAPSLHERLELLLAALTQNATQWIDLEIHEIPATLLRSVEGAYGGCVLAQPVVESVLQRAGNHPVTRRRIPVLLKTAVRCHEMALLVGGAEPTLAQASGILDPVMAEVRYGSGFEFKWGRRNDGRCMLEFSLDRVVEGATTDRLWAAGPGSLSPTTLQLPSYHVTSFDGTVSLAAGQAIRVTGALGRDNVIWIRKMSQCSERFGGTSIIDVTDLTKKEMEYADKSLLGVDLFEYGEMPGLFSDTHSLIEHVKSEAHLALGRNVFDDGPAKELLATFGYDGPLIYQGDNYDLIRGIIQRISAPFLRQFSVEYRYGVSDAIHANSDAGDLRVLDSLVASLPNQCYAISRGAASAGLTSRAVHCLTDVAADVAPEIAAAKPVFTVVHDGASWTARVTPASEDSVMLGCRFSCHEILGDIKRIKLPDPRLGEIDQPRVRRISIHEQRLVALGEWTLIQASPIEGSDHHFVLAARVTRVP